MRAEKRFKEKAVIGLEEGELTMKLRKREQMAAGSRMVGRSSCEENSADALALRAPQLFGPAFRLWPAVVASVLAGDPLLRS